VTQVRHINKHEPGRAKVTPGTHNRKARRAAKAQGALFSEPDSEIERLRAMWEAFGRHMAARIPREFDQREYDVEHHGGPWPEHVPQDWVLDASELYAEEYAALSESEFNAEGARLALMLSGPGGAGLCDADRGGPSGEALETLARAIGLGAVAPGGIKLWGIHVEWTP
jgi:hypothetical protein